MTDASENRARHRGAPRSTPSTSRSPDRMRLHNGRVVHFPAVMGVLNVTPDSFSDGGQYLKPERAIAHALEMQDNGADIIDLGGESTRPSDAREVPAQEELRRVLP